MKENIKIEFAKKSDDKDLRKLMKEITIPGNFQISYQREPSFFDALAVEGYYSHVVVARKTVNNEIIGLGVRSVKQLYINGIEKKIGYLSSLRLSENYRNGFLIAKGYKLFYQLHCKDKVDFYLSTIINDNTEIIIYLNHILSAKNLHLDYLAYSWIILFILIEIYEPRAIIIFAKMLFYRSRALPGQILRVLRKLKQYIGELSRI